MLIGSSTLFYCSETKVFPFSNKVVKNNQPTVSRSVSWSKWIHWVFYAHGIFLLIQEEQMIFETSQCLRHIADMSILFCWPEGLQMSFSVTFLKESCRVILFHCFASMLFCCTWFFLIKCCFFLFLQSRYQNIYTLSNKILKSGLCWYLSCNKCLKKMILWSKNYIEIICTLGLAMPKPNQIFQIVIHLTLTEKLKDFTFSQPYVKLLLKKLSCMPRWCIWS